MMEGLVERVWNRGITRRVVLRSTIVGILPVGLRSTTTAAQTPAAAPADTAGTEMPYWAAQAALAYPGPGRQQAGEREIIVSLAAQRLWAYEDDDPVLSTLVSTGTAETPEVATPLGRFRVLVKFPLETMEGTVSGQDYRVEDVPDVMYFTNEGHALHGTYWHDNFGHPMSHGCVNLPLDVAAWMYGWAPVGTLVTVIP